VKREDGGSVTRIRVSERNRRGGTWRKEGEEREGGYLVEES
jgi:hypothetical protein